MRLQVYLWTDSILKMTSSYSKPIIIPKDEFTLINLRYLFDMDADYVAEPCDIISRDNDTQDYVVFKVFIKTDEEDESIYYEVQVVPREDFYDETIPSHTL